MRSDTSAPTTSRARPARSRAAIGAGAPARGRSFRTLRSGNITQSSNSTELFIPGPMPDDAQTRTDGAPGRGGQGCRATVSSGIGLASYGSRFGAAVQQKRPRERGRPTRKIGRPRARLQGRCRCKRGREKAQEMPWRCPGAAERRLLDARGGGRQWQSDNTKQYTAALISGRQAGVAAQVASTSTGKQHTGHARTRRTQALS